MIYAIIQGFKDFGWNKKNKDIISSKNKAFARLQWITKKKNVVSNPALSDEASIFR